MGREQVSDCDMTSGGGPHEPHAARPSLYERIGVEQGFDMTWAAVGLLTSIIFAFDVATPAGVAMPLLFIIPLLLTIRAASTRVSVFAAGLATVLTIVGWHLSPGSGSFALLNRGLVVVTLWTITALVVWQRRQEQRAVIAERQFKALVEQSFIGIYIIQDGVFEYVNPRFAEIFGYTAGELLALPSAFNVIAESDWNAAQACVESRARETGRTVVYELKGQRLDGTVIDVECYGATMELDGRPAVIGAVADVSERQRLHAELEQSRRELHALAVGYREAQEAERTRIARDLHDELGQRLTALKIRLTMIERDPSTHRAAEIAEQLHRVCRDADEAAKIVHALAWGLRPPVLDDLGLVAALQWQTQEFERLTGVKPTASFTVMEEPKGEQATTIFRIYQEMLTNVARHAGATSVDVRFSQDENGLHLSVADNGNGMDAESLSTVSLGMLGMRERAKSIGGEITIRSRPGSGTTVQFTKSRIA